MSDGVIEVERAPGGADETAALLAQVEALSARLESIADREGRQIAHALMAAMLELYGEGLERIIQALADSGPAGEALIERLAADDLVANLLLVHDLHPLPLDARVEAALDTVRPYMASHGGDVELLSLEGGVARLKLQGSCDGCPSSSSTLELAVRQALEEAAPDLEGIEVEGLVEPRDIPRVTKALPLAGAAPPPPAAPQWLRIEGVAGLEGGTTTSVVVSGARLLLANVGGTLLAYRDGCAGCGTPLAGGELDGGVVTCGSCGRRFELPLAGRIVGGAEPLQLVPVPLLAEDGVIRVALAA